MLYRIIWVNVLVFVFVEVGSFFVPNEGMMWLAATADLEVLKERPWSVGTSMFVHGGPWHLAVNMLPLWWFGRMYQADVGSRKMLSTYVIGGLAGFAALLACVHLLPQLQGYEDRWVLGSSSALFAVIGATAARNPNRKVNFVLFGTVQLQHIALGIVALDYFVRRDHDMAAMIGHLGGVLMGYLLVAQERKGRNLAGWLEWIFDAFMSMLPSKGGGKSVKFRIFKKRKPKQKAHSRPKSDDEFNAERKDKSDRVDAILDKISRHGYDHLTKEEKEFLFKQSSK